MNTNTALVTIIACSDSLDHLADHLAAAVSRVRGSLAAPIVKNRQAC
jgi:hypothetical protein